MDTIIIVESDDRDCQKLKEILENDYHIITCDNIWDIDSYYKNNEIVAIIIGLDFAIKQNVTKLSSYKNKDNTQIPLVVGGEFTGNLLNLLNQGVSEVIVKPYNEAIIKLRINNVVCHAKDNEYRIMADFDALTKIYNRRAFYREAKKLITRNQDINYDLVCFDIDRFKIVNDIYGSSVGDELLIYIADTGIKRMKHYGGLIGRLSGDLFAFVIPHQENIEEKLLQEMNEDIDNFNLGIKVVVSFGYYNIDDLSLPISNMCDRAMMAIKKVKAKYNTSYAIYDDVLRNQVLEEQRIIDKMDRALVNDEFIPYYQPKFNMVTKSFIGYEALMRWISPTQGLIPPSSFIPVFEKNGFISKVDRVIWKKVCKDIVKAREAGHILLPVSVNVSRIELYDLQLGKEILALLNKYNLPIELFQLEITETAYMQDSDQMIEAVKKLKELGFTILMDDFGSGFSSLNILKELPFDIIKIDLAFLEHFDENKKAEKILKSVIQMTKRLNMEIIAEGVETKLQEEFLVELGCNRAQGYRFARPVCASEIFRMLDSGVISIGDSKDEDSAIVNVDDVLSTVHQQGEIDWYRQALLELDAQIFEYDYKRDNMIIFDTPIKAGSSQLAKMEIPNYSYNVNMGRIVHPCDVDKFKEFFKGEKEFKISYRRNLINQESGYVWVKDTGRTFYDDSGKPKISIGVSRVISDEKLNEQMMHVLSVLEQSTDFDSSINHILEEIGNDFSIDRISLLIEDGENYRPLYFWQDKTIQLPVIKSYPTIKDNLQEMIDFFKDNPVVVVSSNIPNDFTPETNLSFFINKAKTVVLFSLTDDAGDFIGCLVISMIQDYRKWRNDELNALHELTKGINVYLNKENIFNRLDNILVTYNRIIDKTSDAILMFTYEKQPKLLCVNRAYQQLLELETISNDNFLEIYMHFISEAAVKKIRQAITDCVLKNEEQIITYQIKLKNNKHFMVKTLFGLGTIKEHGQPVIFALTSKQ